jgi:hypothetical protein
MFLSSIIKFDMIHLQPMQYKNKKLQNWLKVWSMHFSNVIL